jgi:hypothetical protein
MGAKKALSTEGKLGPAVRLVSGTMDIVFFALDLAASFNMALA